MTSDGPAVAEGQLLTFAAGSASGKDLVLEQATAGARGPAGVLAIDNRPGPRDDIDAVLITHLHRDHNGGASAYRDAFPGVSVVSGPDTREFIEINRAVFKSETPPGKPQR